jgi:type IV pilus assembly protein PilA
MFKNAQKFLGQDMSFEVPFVLGLTPEFTLLETLSSHVRRSNLRTKKIIIMQENSRKGFTLVEVMIVVVIIGLLVAMAIPAFQKVQTNAQEKAIEENLRKLAEGADRYFNDFEVNSVSHADLLGADSYVQDFEPVANETYVPDPIVKGEPIQATGGDPGTVTLEF